MLQLGILLVYYMLIAQPFQQFVSVDRVGTLANETIEFINGYI